MNKLYLSGVLAVCTGAAIFISQHDFKAGDYKARNSAKLEIAGEADREARNFERAVTEWYSPLRRNQVTGEIDPAYYYQAVEQANKLASLKFKASLPIQWVERGPDNVGGRTRAFLIDRNNNNVYYAGGISGGLWKSTNAGQSWTLLGDKYENNVISCLVQTSDGAIYFGTGEQAFTQYPNGNENSGFVGGGVFKSTDGVNFTRLSSTAGGGNWSNVNSMAVDPATNRLYAGNEGGLFWSENGGTSWTKVTNTSPMSGNCREVKVASNGKVLALVGTRIYTSDNGKTNYIYSGTGVIATSISRAALAISPQDPNYMYVMTAKPASGGYGLEAVYRTTDGGGSWTKIIAGGSIYFDPVSQALTTAGQGWYDLVLACDPRNRDRIMMGGVQLAEWNNGSAKIIASLFDSPQNTLYVHADKHMIAFDTTFNPAHVIVGTDGGLYKSINNWATFMRMNRGYNTIQFYGVSADRDGNVLGGSQDNGNHYIDGKGNTPLSSMEVKGGDGFRTEIAGQNPSIFFAEYVGGTIQRSQNKGESFSNFFDHRIGDLGNGSNGVQAPFNAAFKLWEDYTPNGDTSSILALGCYNEVWFTNQALDFSVTPTWVRAGVFAGAPLDLEFSDNGNHIFVGTSSGLYRLSGIRSYNFDTIGLPGSSIPPQITVTKLNGITTGRAITGIAIDPADSNRMVITLGNYGNTDYVYMTNNALDANPIFTNITANLPKMPIYAACIPAGSPNIIILGTELGVYASDNNGTSWTEQNNGMARVPVFEIRQYNWKYNSAGKPFGKVGNIYIATHGRGIFETKTFALSAKEVKPSSQQLAVNAYPNPADAYSFITFTLKSASEVSVSVVDIQGREVYSGRKSMAPGVNQLSLETATWSTGTYFVRIVGKDFSGSQKLVVVH